MANDIGTLLNDAALLMVVGMGVVFLFLVTLIGAVNLIAAICARFPDAEQPATHFTPSVSKHVGVTPGVTAAITAAIHQHRKGK